VVTENIWEGSTFTFVLQKQQKAAKHHNKAKVSTEKPKVDPLAKPLFTTSGVTRRAKEAMHSKF